MKNRGQLKEGSFVKVCFADTSGNMVWSYNAVYEDGWFNHKNPEGNARHDTPASIDGCYAWYIVELEEKKYE